MKLGHFEQLYNQRSNIMRNSGRFTHQLRKFNL